MGETEIYYNNTFHPGFPPLIVVFRYHKDTERSNLLSASIASSNQIFLKARISSCNDRYDHTHGCRAPVSGMPVDYAQIVGTAVVVVHKKLAVGFQSAQ